MLAFPPDYTFVVQVISFFVLWLVLKAILWDPMLQLIEQREARTSGATHAAQEMNAAAALSSVDYDRRMKEVRITLAAEAQVAREAIEKTEQAVLTKARDQASAELAQLRDTLGRQSLASRDAIGAEARTLAAQVVDRVVGRRMA